MLSVTLALSLLVVANNAHPHRFFHPPRFFPTEHQSPPMETPTVNIFKIYAPRQIFLTDLKADSSLQDFLPRDKQMMSSVSILDRILDDEIAHNEIVGEEPFFYNHFDEPYQPQPSNIISRKLPAYEEPQFQIHPEFNHPMEMYPNGPMDDSTPRGFAAFIPNFIMDHEHCEHDHMLRNAPHHPMDDFDYPDQFVSVPDFRRAPTFNTHFRPPAMELPSVAPLMTFFESIGRNPDDENKFDTEVMTSITYGEPELVNESTGLSGEQVEKVDDNTGDDEANSGDVVQINRSFIKTILPDNTSVTEEVQIAEQQSENSDEDSNKEPVEEIEVNIVKTILPDNTYTVSEVITDDKIQKDIS